MKKVLKYDEMVVLGRIEDEIKKYVNDFYPELGYGMPKCILGRHGRELCKTSLKKIEKLSKLNKDVDLTQLLIKLYNKEILFGI